MSKVLDAEHGIVCRMPDERFGYFGWPSVARSGDGTLIVASSGLRTEHICPWGKTVINISHDGGKTWSWPRVINDSPIDDRDAGIVCLGGEKLLVSWFTSDTRWYTNTAREAESGPYSWGRAFATWSDDLVEKWLGSWIILSDDGGDTWGKPIPAPVNTPHGPILLSNGDLLYLGKEAIQLHGDGSIKAARSSDGGRTWATLGAVPADVDQGLVG